MGPDQYYTMFEIGGRPVSAGYSLMPDMLEKGVPPHWAVYFAAHDADATAAKVSEKGGTVIEGPFDVADYGRMAVCQDPTGAFFCVWQAKTHPGAAIINEDNAVGWSELATPDVETARQFYTEVLGWETKPSKGMATYIEFKAGGEYRGGLMPMDEQWEGIPAQWGIYFVVADCDLTAAKVKDSGGSVRHGPFDAPGVGRIAICSDPQGAMFSIITLKTAA
jgi:predicted enzyme related to lactoylglutathione lyase